MLGIIQSVMFSQIQKSSRFNVLHPMGWDAFGMPAENAAKQNNLDQELDWSNIVYEKQLKNLVYQLIGKEKFLSQFRLLQTSTTIFLELYEKGLVYRKNYVNWDPVDETVLANEQVIDGRMAIRSSCRRKN